MNGWMQYSKIKNKLKTSDQNQTGVTLRMNIKCLKKQFTS